MEQGLPLARAAERVSWNTVPFDLCDMPSDCFPASDLPSVLIHQAAAHIVAAVPLEEHLTAALEL